MRLRYVLLGDWSRYVRDPIDLLRLAFLVAAIVFFGLGNVAVGIGLTGNFALVVLARQLHLPRPFDLAFVLLIAVQGVGYSANLFAAIPWYDVVLHSTLPGVAATLLYIVLLRVGVVPDLSGPRTTPRRHYVGILLSAVGLGNLIGVIFEIYEYLAVNELGADLVIGYGDTLGDLSLGMLSSLVGGGFLILWSEFGWGTVRRTPLDHGELQSLGRA